MAFKYVVFRENWVGSKVAGMKIAFFAIFDPTWVHKGRRNNITKYVI